jgi:hypothetical protein
MKKLLVGLIIFIILERVTYFQTGGFAPYKILCPSDYISEGLNFQEESTILNQPFYFLDKGTHFFAFLSQDGETVLKFIKHQRSPLNRLFSSKDMSKRSRKIMASCQLAYDHLKHETGLIAVHVYPEPGSIRPIVLYDRLGIAHTIDLNATSYVLQKNAKPCHEDNFSPADLDNCLALIEKRIQKGIVNRDCRMRNFGSLSSHHIEIDVGNFAECLDHDRLQREVAQFTKTLHLHDQEYLVQSLKKN